MDAVRHAAAGAQLLERMCTAIAARDLEALVDCFAVDYVNETPQHPSRGFRGNDQVRRNWEQIFAAVPQLTATVLRSAEADGELWAEWEIGGMRADGVPHLMRGVTVARTDDHCRISWMRFYLEPVQDDGLPVDDAVRTVVGQT